jgi:exodeoxyribonuclease VII large subunit
MVEPEAPPSRTAPVRQVWAVAALVRAVADSLAQRFAVVTVRGEVAAFSRAASGHCYFTLRDADGSAALRCAMFRRAAALLPSMPQDGDAVELRGRLAVYEPRGELQFVVESLQPVGAGALYERFLRLKAQLEVEGLFDAARKRPVMPLPRRVGIVTSLGAAVLRDVATALARRAPHVELLIYPSLVQGPEAPAQLAAAIGLASARAEVDTLLLCRGGGSLEDLWAFNEELVVRAVAACAVPVISGVGHETDVTLADFAADLRAPTPTAAAELAALPRDEALAGLESQARRLARAAQARLDAEAQRLDRGALRLARPGQALAVHQARLARLVGRLRHAAERSITQAHERERRLADRLLQAAALARQRPQQRLALAAARLEGLDPQRTLARGYARLEGADGTPLLSLRQLQVGAGFAAVLADGRVDATVTQLHPAPAAGTEQR